MSAPLVLAVEGGSFSKEKGGMAIMAMLLTEGIIPKRLGFSFIEVDGLDATDALVRWMGCCGTRIDLVISDSVPIAGFNMLDARAIMERTGKPVAFVLPEMPDRAGVEAALKEHFEDWRLRLSILEGAGEPVPLRLGDGVVYFEGTVSDPAAALEVLESVTIFGKVPEPIRLARALAREAGKLVTGMPGSSP